MTTAPAALLSEFTKHNNRFSKPAPSFPPHSSRLLRLPFSHPILTPSPTVDSLRLHDDPDIPRLHVWLVCGDVEYMVFKCVLLLLLNDSNLEP